MATNGFKTPINRNPLFYSDEDFQFETDMMQGYIEEDTNQTVVLYEVDRSSISANDTYKESNSTNIRYKTPKEIPCLYEIKDPNLNAFDSQTNTGSYQVSGNLTCYILTKTLEKYHCDIMRGDYIGVQVDHERMYYFTVTDDGKVNSANKNVVGAYMTAWRVVEAAPDYTFTGI